MLADAIAFELERKAAALACLRRECLQVILASAAIYAKSLFLGDRLHRETPRCN